MKDQMTIKELKAAYEWGKKLIQDLQDAGEEVSVRVYARQLELAEQIIEYNK